MDADCYSVLGPYKGSLRHYVELAVFGPRRENRKQETSQEVRSQDLGLKVNDPSLSYQEPACLGFGSGFREGLRLILKIMHDLNST